MKQILFWLFWVAVGTKGYSAEPTQLKLGELPQQPSLTEQFPHLKNYLRVEKKSNIFFGVGMSPLVFYQNRIGAMANLFQIHWIGDRLDWEVFSASLGASLSSGDKASKHFIARSGPKIRISKTFSVGLMGGMEFASFPNVKARLFRSSFSAPYEPFSTYGPIYGVVITETFPWKDSFQFRISQVGYKQTYPITSPTRQNFGYQFEDPLIEADKNKELLKPGWVYQFEFALLF